MPQNDPCLPQNEPHTAFTALTLGYFWKYLVAVSVLYSQNEPSWLPDSLELLQTIPGQFLADYAQAVVVATVDGFQGREAEVRSVAVLRFD